MTKQKIVISVPMQDAKRKSKALTVVVEFPGVISAEIENGKVSVVGEGIDSVAMTLSLRKKMCHADIVSIEDVKEEKKDKKDKPPVPVIVPPCNWSYQYPTPPELYCYDTPQDTCIIM